MIRKIFLTVAATLVAVTGLFAQELPDDPEVRKGVLDNGMTYYIRHNDKPANQAEFWIFDNVGALQEEDSQQGLAHFLEHMAFNGTENFPGKNMINYLESIGVKFGANLNAFTAQEMTCYNMSNVPVTREGVIDSALLILHDWAYYITLDGDEIDNERGVIVEELRTRQNASWRTNEKLRPYLYGDTRYTTRNIIGSEEGLRSFDHKELRDFYHRWYRTDMQALFIVGDFDVDMMEQKVIALMSRRRAPGTQAANRDCPERRTHRRHHHRPGTHRDQRDALYQEGTDTHRIQQDTGCRHARHARPLHDDHRRRTLQRHRPETRRTVHLRRNVQRLYGQRHGCDARAGQRP